MEETNQIKVPRKMGLTDVAIIGGGLSGLIAAITAAERGKTVRLFTKGAGSLAIGGGTIDVLGYVRDTVPVLTPLAGFSQLPDSHPYLKAGTDTIKEAVDFFLKLCREECFEYTGDLSQAKWLPTAAGTLKPSCLVPKTMDSSILKNAKIILIAAFTGLKDYYPHLILKSVQKCLEKYPGTNPVINLVEIKQEIKGGRDISALDAARFLETEEGLANFITQLTPAVKPGSIVVIPPILGTQPGYSLARIIQERLGCCFLEIVNMPPAITGLRLMKMLVNRAKKAGVIVMEQAEVTGATMDADKCLSVLTHGLPHGHDCQREYLAKTFVLATGGFWSGGLEAGIDGIKETVFDLPVKSPADREEWSRLQFFGETPQNFAKIGLEVNNNFQPIDSMSNLLVQNIYVAGRNIAGCDHAFEKSGNGVALVSGYKIGMSV